ncbi:hypothetical protein DSL72_008495 [Monilinia vaccinii-corymbosi]|uniref:Uncharacterized protein n=1 Tax=Monilinia vaccinii-corymbosi TaxID=61207 RepID=A0A8A3PKV2_9HELO|nr:hypothetical protein DSL72_008495 [Monilinia vaccinii-corymbosi]
MDFYTMLLFFFMMILAFSQDAAAASSAACSSPAGVITTAKTNVGSFGSEIHTMGQTITSTSSPNIVAPAVLSKSTAINITTIIVTSAALHTSAISSSMATGLCFVASQDAHTPCTAGVSAPATSSVSATSPAIRNRPNGLFKKISLKRRAVVATSIQKRATSCDGWQAAIIITALAIAFTLVSILFFATFLKEKREDFPRLFAYKWWVYGMQCLFVALLVWLVVWAAIKTVGNGCN